jgi:hypothetical protein
MFSVGDNKFLDIGSQFFVFLFFKKLTLQVALEDPKRFRIEMTFSRGADLSPLEVSIYTVVAKRVPR